VAEALTNSEDVLVRVLITKVVVVPTVRFCMKAFVVVLFTAVKFVVEAVVIFAFVITAFVVVELPIIRSVILAIVDTKFAKKPLVDVAFKVVLFTA